MHRAFMKLPNWPTQVTLLEDGQKALWYLQSLEHGGVQEPPSVVLLDMNLPKYDGLHVLKAFRNSVVVWDMPVFVYSSAPSDEIAAIADGLNLRADGYFEKPYGVDGYNSIAVNIRSYLETSNHGLEMLARIISGARMPDGLEQAISAHS